MNKLACAIAVAALIGTPAFAADMAVKAPPPAPPVAPVFDWTGFYVGGNAGGGWGNNCWTFVDTIPPGNVSAGKFDGCYGTSGGIAGGQIGASWQRGTWVFGVEFSGDWANLTGSRNSPITATNDLISTKVTSMELLTGRVGYAWNNLQIYAEGGGAWVNENYARALGVAAFGFPAGTTFATTSETRVGWTIGAGLEYGFAPNWSVGLEYDYIGLGTRRVTFPINAAGMAMGFSPAFLQDIRQNDNLLDVRLNYRFGAGLLTGSH